MADSSKNRYIQTLGITVRPHGVYNNIVITKKGVIYFRTPKPSKKQKPKQ